MLLLALVLILIRDRKSKLRNPEPIDLGKQYAGSRVSRDALEDESDDDPFKARSSEEDENDSDEDKEGGAELDTGDDEGSDSENAADASADDMSDKAKPSRKKSTRQRNEPESENEVDGTGSDGSDDVEGSEGSDDESEDGLDDEDMDIEGYEDEDEDGDDDEDEDDRREKPKGAKTNDREELRQLMATDQKTITSSISQAAKADAVKGNAVKQQRSTFDALLNTRIKLQKGLTTVNQLSVAAKDVGSAETEAVTSAESAALSLWSTLEDLRYALADAQSDESKKRKRPSPTSVTTSTDSLWKRMADLESESVNHRRTVLDKWSQKVRGSNASLPNARGKLLGPGSGGQQTITTVLDSQLASEAGERSAKRSRHANANGTTGESHEPIYDDSIFYQTLLRELVEQRMSSDSLTNGLDTLHIQLPSKLSLHPVTGMRNDKNRRQNVDTRATKGRKMRYDVHEKLQNFMAPEDRGTWTTRARDEFFASLLGRTASGMLGEDDEDVSADEENENDREEIGLRLFRN